MKHHHLVMTSYQKNTIKKTLKKIMYNHVIPKQRLHKHWLTNECKGGLRYCAQCGSCFLDSIALNTPRLIRKCTMYLNSAYGFIEDCEVQYKKRVKETKSFGLPSYRKTPSHFDCMWRFWLSSGGDFWFRL